MSVPKLASLPAWLGHISRFRESLVQLGKGGVEREEVHGSVWIRCTCKACWRCGIVSRVKSWAQRERSGGGRVAQSQGSQELGKSGIWWRKQGDKSVTSPVLIKTKLLQLTARLFGNV